MPCVTVALAVLEGCKMFECNECEYPCIVDTGDERIKPKYCPMTGEGADYIDDNIDCIDDTINDIINHPAHYVEGRKFEPIDVINDWDLNFNLGNAVKYIARAGRKNDPIEDLEKAVFYIQYEITQIKSGLEND